MERFPDMEYSISTTTRPLRSGEKEGTDYFFLRRDEFEKRISENVWAEWAKVYGHYYGTSAEFLDGKRSAGKSVLLDIDVQGACQILRRYPDSVTIFIMPPSLHILRERLLKRGTDNRETIEKRLAAAKSEIDQSGIYRHIVVNDDLDHAISSLVDIIRKYRVHSD